jgi:hypothetical protein
VGEAWAIRKGKNMSRTLYTIERLADNLASTEIKWRPLSVAFQSMNKSYAEGAFAMIKAHYGTGRQYRLVDNQGNVVDEWNTPKLSPRYAR